MHDIPKPLDGWREIADCLVWYSAWMGVVTPIMSIFSGTLWGPLAFVGGAAVVATILFVDLYFRDPVDVEL